MGLFGFGKKKDEYDDIYNQYEGSGFEFNYYKRISKSKPIFKDAIDILDSSKSNHDEIPLFVNCKRCGTYMDYQISNSGTGWWKCPSCGARVKESTVYNQINRENDAYLDEMDFSYSDIPESCQACGGPWPDCQTSCKLFDD